MKQITLDDCYSLWIWPMFGFAIPGVLALVLMVVLGVYAGDNETIGVIIGYAATITIAAICAMGLGIQLYQRHEVRKKVDTFVNYDVGVERISSQWPTQYEPKPIAFRRDGVKQTSLWLRFMAGIDKVSPVNFLIAEVEDKLRDTGIRLKYKGWQPITFVTFKPEGKVFWEWRGLRRRCRGIAKSHWCEVEWSNDLQRVRSLLVHELAHVILSASFPSMGTAQQHNVMRQAGIR